MHHLTSDDMPSLVFSINFDKYYKQINRISYVNETERIGLNLKFIEVEGVEIIPSFTKGLPIKKLCHPKKPKYDDKTNKCSRVTICNDASLCSDEDTPIICNDDFVYDPFKEECTNVCSEGYGRGAMSDKSISICNRKCDIYMNNCDGISPDQTQNNFENNECEDKFVRYGYKCISEPIAKKSNFRFNFI